MVVRYYNALKEASKNGNELIESMSERLSGRFAAEDIKHPETGEIIVARVKEEDFYYTIPALYTDGKNVYGFNYANPYESKTTSGMVRLLIEDMEAVKDSGILGIGIEFLTE